MPPKPVSPLEARFHGGTAPASACPLARKRSPDHISSIDVRGSAIGGGRFVVVAGPCAIESYEQFRGLADTVVAQGLQFMRGGAFKPRTSPYSFDGLHREGLEILRRVKDETGVRCVTELMSIPDLDAVAEVADIVQIGSRHMQNFPLLHAVGGLAKPVLLKRGFGNTLEELLLAAEHILSRGNSSVILCERGIRTFDHSQRNTLDLMAVPILKSETHLPVIVDPSHSVGRPRFIPAAVQGALALGADGVMVEVHPDPDAALSDGPQSLSLAEFGAMMEALRKMASALGRELS